MVTSKKNLRPEFRPCKVAHPRLAMEFAVEAQKLLGVSLEGSVG